MNRKLSTARAALLSLFFSPAALAADDRDDSTGDESGAEESTAPDVVAGTVARRFPQAKVRSVQRAGESWRLQLADGLSSREVLVGDTGELLAQSEVVPPNRAPAALRRAVQRQFGTANVWRTERVVGADGEVWRVTFSTRSRVGEAVVDGEGRLLQASFERG